MSEKLRVGVLFGGNSPEHEVSKMTAESILQNIDREKYDVVEVYIAKDGSMDESLLERIDVAVLAVHGPNCEDGVLQQFLEDRGIPYTGPGVEASRLNMDKIAQHEAFAKAGLRITKYLTYSHGDDRGTLKEKTKSELNYPVFIKPNNAGSSIGAAKVEDEGKIDPALDEALKHDNKVIIEKAVNVKKELEVSVLGNDDLVISQPGEILANGEFYSYDTKYFHPFETATVAEGLSEDEKQTLQDWAEKAYRATGCAGYSRVDFLLDRDGTIYINEINTLPGFTKISMFPKMMAESGISYAELIDRLIQLALERHKKITGEPVSA